MVLPSFAWLQVVLRTTDCIISVAVVLKSRELILWAQLCARIAWHTSLILLL